MNKQIVIISIILIVSTTWLVSCQHKPFAVPVAAADSTYGNFPKEIGQIIVTRCANGCHDAANYKLNANLKLDTWEHMFEGANNGAVVVPYSPQFSSLMFFINTDTSNHEPITFPTMPYNENPPYNRPPLTKDEYNLIKNWIAEGAPSKDGKIPFAEDAATRQKIYMTMQGCSLLAVIDAKTKLIMRYVNVGDADNSLPHAVHVSWDGQYAYVCFAKGHTIQKINTTTDQIAGSIDLNQNPSQFNPPGFFWNAFNISSNDSMIAASTLDNAGKLMVFNTSTMSNPLALVNNLHNLHGIFGNANFDTIFVTSQYGNAIYKIAYDKVNIGSSYETITIDGSLPKYTSDSPASTSFDPHDILMIPGDDSKYFVTCQNSNQVVLMDAHTNQKLGSISVGIKPQEIAISKSKHMLFVTCMEDVSNTSPGAWKGSVYAIDYINPFAAPTRIDGTFYQPHGITVDDKEGVIYIPSRNVNPNGPAPHHSSGCSGGSQRNGFYQVYDLNTLKPLFNDKKFEATPDPYSADVRFK